jgi:DNA-binding response OmpR family regulator
MRILIVDDDKPFLEQLKLGLRKEYQFIDTANCIRNAKESISDKKYNVILLDYNLGLNTGIELLNSLQNLKDKPKVILMTSFATKEIAISALNNGIEKFIEKPFRLSALKKIIGSISQKKISQSYQLDYDKLEVHHNGDIILLTPIEMRLFCLLVNSNKKLLLREEIHEHLFGNDVKARNTLGVHFTNLKKKVPFIDQNLENIRGKGYIFDIQ